MSNWNAPQHVFPGCSMFVERSCVCSLSFSTCSMQLYWCWIEFLKFRPALYEDSTIMLDQCNWVQRVHWIYWVLAQDDIWGMCMNVCFLGPLSIFPKALIIDVSPTLKTGSQSAWRFFLANESQLQIKNSSFLQLGPIDSFISFLHCYHYWMAG